MLTVLIRRCVAACGGEKRREAGEAMRLRLLLLRLPSKVPKCAKKIQVFASRRKKHTQKKTKTSPAGGGNAPRRTLCRTVAVWRSDNVKNYKTVTQDGRCQLLEAASKTHRPAVTLELRMYLFFCIVFFFSQQSPSVQRGTVWCSGAAAAVNGDPRWSRGAKEGEGGGGRLGLELERGSEVCWRNQPWGKWMGGGEGAGGH